MRQRNARLLSATLLAACALLPAAEKERAPIGGFTSVKLAKAPVIDGKVSPGEWDRAFTTAGMMTPFEQQLQTAETVMSLGHDDKNFYFLFRCKRGNFEWRLMKSVRENDGYSYGDPSVEVWVTPPKMVPETYQSVINTYPAVMDNHQIPTRGYTAMGWKGNWKLGVDENATDYVIEASIPISDFGLDTVKDGDVWRFLLCRTCHGAMPRPQASWSLTQGFAEIPQHPEVLLSDDGVVVQLTGVTSLFTGTYALPLAVAAPLGRAAELEVEVRSHKTATLGAADDVVEVQQLSLKAGERKELTLKGTEAGGDKKQANLTLTVREKGQERPVFRETFPYTVNGWTQTAPTRPEKDKLPDELAISSMYGPETKTVVVKADIFDLPANKEVKSGTVRIFDPASGKVLAEKPLSRFRADYANAVIKLPADLAIPVVDFATQNKARAEFMAKWEAEQKAREEKEPVTDQKILNERDHIAKGSAPPTTYPPGWPKPPRSVLPPTPEKVVQVEVTVADASGKTLKTATQDLKLLAYKAEWMDNDVGITDKVIPPWTPIARDGAKVSVWNRSYGLDGLGLVRSISNGGAAQISSMRLIASVGGKETAIDGGAFEVKRLVEAEADLTGGATVGDLKVSAQTRVEFDGFVKNTWTLAPSGNAPAKLDRLTLEVVLPEAEATHFLVTSGGWAATHDVTPAHWDSRTTANGMLIGDWVPYIWLTNGDRAFQWFADSDQGWIHDANKELPTQEIERKDGMVTLRVHFVEIPAEIAKARTFTWGWQTFPSRPLPDGFRAQFCGNGSSAPNAKASFFWTDADWSVLWPYYCGPYPWSFRKSKWFFDRSPAEGTHHPLVGSIAHSLGRYRDYEGNEFPALVADWGMTPGQIGNGDVTASKGPNDFRLWYYRRWVREAGFRGVYVDENYLGIEENFLTGNAWIMDDGRLQRGYNYLGLREYFKRMRVMFTQEGVKTPSIWQHISSGAAYNAWFGDVFMEGENVEPTNEQFDYIEVLPAGRLRAIGSPVTAGGMMMMMCQPMRHPSKWADKHVHQFTGWVMAHDITPEQVPVYPFLCEAAKLYEPGVKFLPYWKESTPFKTTAKDCVVSAHRASDRAICWVVNTSRQAQSVQVTVDWKALGLDPAKCVVVEAEYGKAIAADAKGLTVQVAERDYVPVLIIESGPLAAGETFAAGFDKTALADKALGLRNLTSVSRNQAIELVAGKTGQAAATGAGIQVPAWLHLDDEAGRITCDALFAAQAKGQVLAIGELCEVVARQDPADKKTMQLALVARTDAKDKEPIAVTLPLPAAGWHAVQVQWKGGQATLSVDGATSQPLAVAPFGFAPKVRAAPEGINPGLSAGVVLGRGGKAIEAVDNLRLAR